jgi:hypothetical protein
MERAAPLVLIVLLAAGCVGAPAATDEPGALDGALASLACFEGVCNFEATTVNTEGNEVTIAVNPLDPLNIVAGAKDYSPWTAGDCV